MRTQRALMRCIITYFGKVIGLYISFYFHIGRALENVRMILFRWLLYKVDVLICILKRYREFKLYVKMCADSFESYFYNIYIMWWSSMTFASRIFVNESLMDMLMFFIALWIPY